VKALDLVHVGMEAWKSSERIKLLIYDVYNALMVSIMHSVLSFCGEVYGHDMCSKVSRESRKDYVDVLLNSFPLSHYTL
jgi:hypothetical protein